MADELGDARASSPRPRPACWPPWAWSWPASAATTCRRVLAPVDAGARPGRSPRAPAPARRGRAPRGRDTAPRPTAATSARATPSPSPWDPAAPETRLAGDFHAAHRAPLRRRRRRAPGRGRHRCAWPPSAPARPGPALRAEPGDATVGGPGRDPDGRGHLLGGARAGRARGGRRRHAWCWSAR